MQQFNKKATYLAVAGATLAMAGAASAVNVNPDGLGEVLIYPYYTVNNGTTTLMSIVNTTNRSKMVKVRFLEGKNTAEVLDFNLWLSPKDVWTAAVVEDAGGGARLITADKSCTNPAIPATGVPFRGDAYQNDNSTLRGIARTREGYMEVIEMATVKPGSATDVTVTHVNGVPPCKPTIISNTGLSANLADYTGPSGGLFGAGTFISGGMSTAYTATAIEGFGYTSGPTASGDLTPSLNSGSNVTAVVVSSPTAGTSKISSATFSRSIDAVSAVLMHREVYGEYAYTDDRVFSTDWVLTFPTKREYVNGSSPVQPFQRIWNGRQTTPSNGDGTACLDIEVSSYDREEGTGLSDDFSPSPNRTNQLCWESTVISFGGLVSGRSRVLGSANAAGFNAFQAGNTTGKEGGWAELRFTNAANRLVSTSGQTTLVTDAGIAPPTSAPITFFGLPVVGFSVTEARQTVGSTNNFNSSVNLTFKRQISP